MGRLITGSLDSFKNWLIHRMKHRVAMHCCKKTDCQGWAGHQAQTTFDDELAQDCKHKEIIKGANEEGNEITQVGQINQ